MPYTDYNQVLQDIADNIREVNGTADPIRFVDMPDLIEGFIGPRISLANESGSGLLPRSYPWRRKLIQYIGNTVGMTDMSYMFYNLEYGDAASPQVENLKDLDLSHFDTSDVTNMSWMFRYVRCKSVNLSSFDTSNVTDMHGMFDGMQTVVCLDLSNFDTSNVTNMNSMLSHIVCWGNSIDLDLTHFDTSKVTDMRNTFEGIRCIPYSTYPDPPYVILDVTGWDVSKVTNFQECFYYNLDYHLSTSSITELDLSGWDTSSATNMWRMFESPYLRKIWVPSTFVATQCSSGNKPFVEASSQQNCHVYTDATSATAQDWGTISSGFTMHYNSTHADYENA